MATGKYISIEEARKQGELERFAKEHPAEGDADKWEKLFQSMAGLKEPLEGEASLSQGRSEGYSGIRTRPDTLEDAS